MVESGFIQIHLNARVGRFLDVRAAGPFYELGVGMQRNHQPDVHSCQRRGTHGKHYRLRREEVWSLHVDVSFRFEQYPYVSLHHLRPWTDGAARYDLHYAVVVYVAVKHGVVTPVGNECAVNKEPVDKKSALNAVHGATANAHVRVPPCAPVAAFHVAHGNVHAADISYLAVYYAQLAVVAVVHLACKRREFYGHEGVYVNSGVAHLLEERVGNIPAPHVVVYKADLHSLPCLVRERVGQ